MRNRAFLIEGEAPRIDVPYNQIASRTRIHSGYKDTDTVFLR